MNTEPPPASFQCEDEKMLGTQTIRILVVFSMACGGKAKQPAPKPAPTAKSVPATPAAATAQTASPNVSVSDELAKRCSLNLASDRAPKFAFDEAELTTQDRNLLEQVAECLVRGPLKDRSVQLVGRADPRGTEEYNLGLGTRRAESVRTYLQRLGVPPSRLAPTTRGDLDANGNDEVSWQRDRRVDLQLVN